MKTCSPENMTPSFARVVAPVLLLCLLPCVVAFTAEAPKDLESIEAVMYLASQTEHEAAVALFDKVRMERPETIQSIHGHKVAVLYAALGDAGRHRAHCRWLMKRYETATQPTDAERSVKGYLLFPSADDPALLEHALERTTLATDHAEERGEGQYLLWFEGARGMAEYRMGNHETAVAYLEKSAAAEDLYINSLALPYLAMAEFALGNEERAAAVLEQARAAAAKLPEPGTEEYEKEWTDTLTSQIALREAETVISTGKNTPAAKE